MKMKWIISLVVVSILLGGTYLFLGPARVRTAKKNALEQIDALLGECKVKREHIQVGVENADKAVERLAEGKIRVKVEADQLDKKVQDIQQKITEAENNLKTLREHLASESPVVLAGKSYTKDDLKKMADKVISAHKTLTTELKAMKEGQERLEARLASLEEKHAEAKKRRDTLKSEMKRIDNNIAQLNILKKTREAAGDSDKTVAENFEQLQNDINDLDAHVKVQLAREDEKWKESAAAGDVEDVGKFIRATKGAEGTLSEIDRILEKK